MRRPFLTLLAVLGALVLTCAPQESSTLSEAPESVPASDTAVAEPAVPPAPAFSPQATLTLRDGSTLAVTEFSLVGTPHDPSGMYFEGRSSDLISIPLLMGNERWREVDPASVAVLSLEPDPPNEYPDWFDATLQLASGETIKGRIPVGPSSAWHNARRYEFHGRSIALGVEGSFEMEFIQLRHAERVNGQTMKLTDAKGTEFTVKDVTFHEYWSAPLHQSRCAWTDGSIPVTVGNTEVEVRIQDIESMRFTHRDWEAPIANIRMRNGEEAKGTLDEQYGRAFGRAENGEIWFGYLERILSIEFASPPPDTPASSQ